MTKNLILRRLKSDGMATQGELHRDPAPGFLCFTLELPWRDNERNVSRIPAGRWPLRLRNQGGFYQDYSKRWPWRREVIEIVVPDRTFILFHIGNTHEDTNGCILLGAEARPDVSNGGDRMDLRANGAGQDHPKQHHRCNGMD